MVSQNSALRYKGNSDDTLSELGFLTSGRRREIETPG